MGHVCRTGYTRGRVSPTFQVVRIIVLLCNTQTWPISLLRSLFNMSVTIVSNSPFVLGEENYVNEERNVCHRLLMFTLLNFKNYDPLLYANFLLKMVYTNSLLVLQSFTTTPKSGNITLTSDTHQSIKRRIVTQRLTEIYTQISYT